MRFFVVPRLLGGLMMSFCFSPAVFAHDYWIERDGDAYVLYQGHLYAAHAGEERVVYDPAIVRQTYCARSDGELTRSPASATYPFRLTGTCAAVFIQASSGYWSQSLTGTKNKPKTEVSGVLRSWLSEESIKFIESWTPRLSGPLTEGLELVPLSDPHALTPGDKLQLLATWRGKPKAGVTVAYQGDPRGVTGADGTVNIRLRQGGTQVLSASFEEPLNDAKADKIVRATILQFQLR